MEVGKGVHARNSPDAPKKKAKIGHRIWEKCRSGKKGREAIKICKYRFLERKDTRFGMSKNHKRFGDYGDKN